MAFIDEIRVHMKAGRGGHGVVRWHHEKGRDLAGAAGGDGGNGGDVYARALRDIAILARYRHKKEFVSERGQDGMKKSMFGRNGKDFYLEVPTGSVITNLTTGESQELLKEGDTAFLLKGGRGGLGNEHFKASTNTTPWESTDGRPGEEGDFLIELQLIVDAGLVGFPNAGKSSLLNALTNAHVKVGNYAFTTLEPNLGDFHGFILGDIPGLIEGASSGKGLGYKFLRHIKRTKIILHCISMENATELGGQGIAEAYKTIRGELESYGNGSGTDGGNGADGAAGKTLAAKKEVIILTKTDLVEPAVLKKYIKEAAKLSVGKATKRTVKPAKASGVKPLKAAAKEVLTISVYDDVSIKAFSDSLVKILRAG